MKSRRKSLLWSLFEAIDGNRAKCNACKQNFSYRTSTSNLAKHLRKRHPSIIAALRKSQINVKLPITICDKSEEEDYPENLQKTHEIFINDTTDGEVETTVVNSSTSPTPSLSNHISRDQHTEVKKERIPKKRSEPVYSIFKPNDYNDSHTFTQNKLSQDECETFGKIVASHLKELPISIALECQSDILHHLVQKRLGRSFDSRLLHYPNDSSTEQIIVQAWENTD